MKYPLSNTLCFHTKIKRSLLPSCFQGNAHRRFMIWVLFLISACFLGMTGSLVSQTIDVEGGTSQTNANTTLILNTNGTITVSGDYNNTSSGTFQYDVASPSTTPRLLVDGNAFLDGTLNVNFTQGTFDGDKNAILSAGSFIGNYINVGVYTNSVLDPLHRKRLFMSTNSTLYGVTAPTSYAQVALTQNQSQVALALNSFIPPEGTMTNTTDESIVSFSLDQLTDAQYPNASNTISTALYTSMATITFNNAVAQSLDLSVANVNANSLIYSLGSHCFYTWEASKDILVVPQINLGWQHEFLQNPYALNSSLGNGASFAYMSTTSQRDSLYNGLGFSMTFAKKHDTSFFYNASACNPSLVSQNFFTSLGMKF